MSSALAKTEKAVGWLTRPETMDRLGGALAGFMDQTTFVSQMLIAFNQPGIAECSERSKFKAAHDCASLQLLPSLGQVGLVPRNCNVEPDKNKPAKWEKQCHAMPQWQGYKSLMERNPEILEVNATIVFVGETCTTDAEGNMSHTFDPLSNDREVKKDLSNIQGGYLTILYRDPERKPKYHFTTAKHIRKCKACAKAGPIWDNWTTQMVLKTIYRDGYARRAVPIDTVVNHYLQRATEMEDRALQNDPNRPARISSLNDRPHETHPAVSQLLDGPDDEPETQEEPPQTESKELSKWVAKVEKCKTEKDVRNVIGEAAANADLDSDTFDELEKAASARIVEITSTKETV